MHDLIIIGGGPAGLTAAIYAIRKRLDVVVVSHDLGGKTRHHMEMPWGEPHRVIRGAPIIEKFQRELEYLGFVHRAEGVSEVRREEGGGESGEGVFRVTLFDGEELEAWSVILATGADVEMLGVPGELDYIGRGLSYSAISYASLFLGRPTVVVGRGMLGLRAVAELSRVSSSVVFIVPGRDGEDADDDALMLAVTSDPRVTVIRDRRVVAIEGGAFVERVVLEGPGGRESIPADGVFIELSLVPVTDPVRGLVDLDEQGRVIVDNACRTSCAGLFAAGDVTNSYAEQVLVAVGEGAKAALASYEYLMFRRTMAMAGRPGAGG